MREETTIFLANSYCTGHLKFLLIFIRVNYIYQKYILFFLFRSVFQICAISLIVSFHSFSNSMFDPFKIIGILYIANLLEKCLADLLGIDAYYKISRHHFTVRLYTSHSAIQLKLFVLYSII